MKYQIGLGSQTSAISNTYNSSNQQQNTQQTIGKVYGVITTLNTPTKEAFEANGGFNGIGTIFYLNYDETSKNKDSVNDILKECSTAKPFHASNQNYPLIGELVTISILPSTDFQLSSPSTQAYYTGTINLWNNNQQNSPAGNTLGKTFIENSDIRKLLSFEGDRIYQGRKGNGLRFGSTIKFHSERNEWSSIGEDGDPITILVNGYVTLDTGSLVPNIEEVNKELSSIYLTSTQKIPLLPGVSIINKNIKTILPTDYFNPQIILNSDRITLNSKKDEVLIYSKTNIELNTDNIVNINAGNRIHLNTPTIWLGNKADGTSPTEAILLGNKTVDLLNQILTVLETLGNDLTKVVTPPPGSPLTGVNVAGSRLTGNLTEVHKKLIDILSNNNFTS
jgi:hypothetical protein